MHDENYKLHLSIHKMVEVFNPFNTNNTLFLDFLNNKMFWDDINNKANLTIIDEFNPYILSFSKIIPASYLYLLQNMKIIWVHLIDNFVFGEKLYNTFYAEYCDVFDKVVFCDFNNIESTIFREYKTGESIFHFAAKSRLINVFLYLKTININEKIVNLDNELNYIIKCYEDFGKVFKNGNKLTINYMEDKNGVYLVDYITKFSDGLVNRSLSFPK